MRYTTNLNWWMPDFFHQQWTRGLVTSVDLLTTGRLQISTFQSGLMKKTVILQEFEMILSAWRLLAVHEHFFLYDRISPLQPVMS